jgi:sarcosine oxidase delta subunit
VYEFRYGGEVPPVNGKGSNLPAAQRERWYHRFGCRRWLVAERDVRTNEVLHTVWLDQEAP